MAGYGAVISCTDDVAAAPSNWPLFYKLEILIGLFVAAMS